MPQRTHAVLLFALLLALPSSASGSVRDDFDEITDTVRRTFSVLPGGTLDLELDRGNIAVREGEGNRVTVEVRRRARVARGVQPKQVWDLHDLRIDERHGNVRVASSWERGEGRGWMGRDRVWEDVQVDVRVTVPRAFNVSFRTGAGNVGVEEIAGEVGGRTGAGNVTLLGIDGAVDIYTGSGNVSIDRVDGDVRLNTGAGNVAVERILGQVTARTGAGNIVGYFPRATGAPISLATGAGNVEAIVRSGVGFDVEARTGIGTASTQYDLEVSDGMMGGRFAGRINGGGPQLSMRSGIGNVELRRR
jgi:DUF4097 and DUF4098 domain-containing protein YvlB